METEEDNDDHNANFERMRSKKRKGDDTERRKLDLLGVSVHWLTTGLLSEIRELGFDETSACIHDLEDLTGPSLGVARRKGKDVISPVDQRMGASYVHCLVGDDNVGPANRMLSYTWSYAYGDVMKALKDYCSDSKLNPKRTYVWIDFLCINQHRVVQAKEQGGTGLLNFEQEFPDQLSSIGHMLAMMSPWNDPIYLKRIWCIFEMYTATERQCNVTVIMPSKEKDSLEEDLFRGDPNDFNKLYQALARTKVQNAQASFDGDRETILGMIEKEGVGYNELNNKVNEFLRSWIRVAINKIIENRLTKEEIHANSVDGNVTENEIDLMHQIGNFLRQIGELDESLKWLSRCLSTYGETKKGAAPHQNNNEDDSVAKIHLDIGEVLRDKGDFVGALVESRKAVTIYELLFGKTHPRTADGYSFMGRVFLAKGDFDGALVEHQKALEIRETVFGKQHLDTAESYTYLGMVYSSKNDSERALEKYRLALAIRESTLGKEHPETADSYTYIGNVLSRQGRSDEALSEYCKAKNILESAFGSEHVKSAHLYNEIGNLFFHTGEVEKAMVEYRKALTIREEVLGIENPTTANSYNNIGNLLLRRKDWDGALAEHRKALTIRVRTIGKDHPKTASSYNNIAKILVNQQKYEEAIVEFRKALSIREAAFGKDHPETANSLYNLADALFKSGNIREALGFCRQALSVYISKLGKRHRKSTTTQSFFKKLSGYVSLSRRRSPSKSRPDYIIHPRHSGTPREQGRYGSNRSSRTTSRDERRYNPLGTRHDGRGYK